MRRVLLGSLVLLSILPARIFAATWIVAPGGNDSHPGTRAQPLATLEAARDAARAAGAGPHRILLLPGEYFLTRTVELDARDSGLTVEAEEPGKATLYGGTPVTAWRRDGDKFWSAGVPGVKEGTWDFRAVIVNGRMPDRARMPETGTFLHKSEFPVRWLSSVGGGWERKPTDTELSTLRFDSKDLPAMLEPGNAEVRVYHMWDESLCGISAIDTANSTLSLAPPAKSPPGAFGVKKYVVWNTREGMTRPGQWYLDRAAGRIVYWPLPGEDMTTARVIAPRVQRVIQVGVSTQPPSVPAARNSRMPVQKVTIRNLSIQGTTTPLKSGGFGAYAFEGALSIEHARDCNFEKLEICNVGGQGIVARDFLNSRIADCHIHHAGACGIKAEGSNSTIARNHIHHIGAHYPSAVAVSVSHYQWRTIEKGFHLHRNEIHDTPYSGVIGSGGGHLIEENLICRVMRELQDGGAIYGGMSRCILRGNIVRDVVKMGDGYGVSSYYLDEGAQDCIVERNVSIGVERPTHNHIARNLIIRNNVFVANENMTLSFQRSANCAFEGNTLFVPGKISISQPSAIKSWTGNAIFRTGPDDKDPARAFTIDDAMPPAPKQARRTTVLNVPKLAKPPTIDGNMETDEWPGTHQSLDREPSRDPGSGAPVFIKIGYDDQNLYVGVTVAMFEPARLTRGNVWGTDDGIEVAIGSPLPAAPGNKPSTAPANTPAFIFRGFVNGTVQSSNEGGAPDDVANRLAKSARFAAQPFGKTRGGWRGEWAIPFKDLGINPAPGMKLPFNITTFRAEDGTWRCWEGTLAQSWKISEAGVMHLR